MTAQFSVLNYGKSKESELKSLTTTAQDLLHLLAEFAEYNNVKDEMKLVLTYNELQEINTDKSKTLRHFNSTFIKICSIL